MIVYQAKYYIQLIYIVLLCMYAGNLIAGILIYIKASKSGYDSKTEKGTKIFSIVFCSVMFVGITLFAVYFVSDDISTYKDTYKKFKNGEYKQVEGYVRNFQIKQDEDLGSDDEEFDIGGTHFEVYAGEPWPYWYSPLDNGTGVINHDGQYVRVKYETHKNKLSGKERKYIMEIYLPVIVD